MPFIYLLSFASTGFKNYLFIPECCYELFIYLFPNGLVGFHLFIYFRLDHMEPRFIYLFPVGSMEDVDLFIYFRQLHRGFYLFISDRYPPGTIYLFISDWNC